MPATTPPSIWHRLWRRASPLDRLAFIYILAFGLGLVFLAKPEPARNILILVHTGLLVAIVAILQFWNDRRTGISGFIRLLWVPLLYALFYSEAQVAIHWVFPEFFDGQLIALERWLFGVVPNAWLIPFQTRLLNEWMMFGYFSYYLLVPILGLTLFFRRRYVPLNGFLTAATIAFVISYIGFIVYPVEGPRYFMAAQFTEPLHGYIFVPVVQAIIAKGAIHGGCMPSSHVAVALVVLVWAYRSIRRLGIVLTPIVATLFVATVWGRFHYFMDVVVGVVVGLIGLHVGDWWTKDRSGSPLGDWEESPAESSVTRA